MDNSKIIDESKAIKKQKKFNEIIKYDNQLPIVFDFGDLKTKEEKITYSIIGEIRNRIYYNEDGDRLSRFYFDELALLSGSTETKNGKVYPVVNAEFRKTIDNIIDKLSAVSYKMPIYIGDDLENAILDKDSYKKIMLFSKFEKRSTEKYIELKLSNEIFQEAITDNKGNIIAPEKRVYDLFEKLDWSKSEYSQISRKIHNQLGTQYALRLYRLLSKFRKTGIIYIKADDFEEDWMKLNTPSKRKKRISIVDDSIERLLRLVDENTGKPIFSFIEVDRIKEKVRTETGVRSVLVRYEFRFSPFTTDLPQSLLMPLDEAINDKMSKNQKKIDFTLIMNKFNLVFSDPISKVNKWNTKSNQNNLKKFLKEMDADVIIEALDITGANNKGFNYTIGILKKWRDVGHVKTFDDLKAYNADYYSTSSIEKKINDYKQKSDVLSEDDITADKEALLVIQIDAVTERLKDSTLKSYDKVKMEQVRDYLVHELNKLTVVPDQTDGISKEKSVLDDKDDSIQTTENTNQSEEKGNMDNFFDAVETFKEKINS